MLSIVVKLVAAHLATRMLTRGSTMAPARLRHPVLRVLLALVRLSCRVLLTLIGTGRLTAHVEPARTARPGSAPRRRRVVLTLHAKPTTGAA